MSIFLRLYEDWIAFWRTDSIQEMTPIRFSFGKRRRRRGEGGSGGRELCTRQTNTAKIIPLL